VPAVKLDLVEREEEYVVRTDLPGMKKEGKRRARTITAFINPVSYGLVPRPSEGGRGDKASAALPLCYDRPCH
jgi:hypothetical protein